MAISICPRRQDSTDLTNASKRSHVIDYRKFQSTNYLPATALTIPAPFSSRTYL